MDLSACFAWAIMPKRNGILASLGLNVRRQREAKELTQEKLGE